MGNMDTKSTEGLITRSGKECRGSKWKTTAWKVGAVLAAGGLIARHLDSNSWPLWESREFGETAKFRKVDEGWRWNKVSY